MDFWNGKRKWGFEFLGFGGSGLNYQSNPLNKLGE